MEMDKHTNKGFYFLFFLTAPFHFQMLSFHFGFNLDPNSSYLTSRVVRECADPTCCPMLSQQLSLCHCGLQNQCHLVDLSSLPSFTFGFGEIKEVARWGGGGASSSLFSVKHKLLFPELSVSLKATGIILSLSGSLRGGSGGAQLMLEQRQLLCDKKMPQKEGQNFISFLFLYSKFF